MPDADGAAGRIADALRDRILDGRLVPGARLPEEQVRAEHGVSRSTLREAFGRLIKEGLLVRELSRGVFVRRLSRDDVTEIYEVRRVLEVGAVQGVTQLMPSRLRRIADAIADGERAERVGDWRGVASASIRFHEALVALAGNRRLDVLAGRVLAEFRLAYAHMTDPQVFHAAFLKRHHAIADAIGSGALDEAAELLRTYLVDAESELLAAFDT